PGLRLQRHGRDAARRHRADPADVQVDRRRGMRPRRGYPAVAAGAGMTERPTARHVVEGGALSGKAWVITGASSRLGRGAGRALAAAGAHVILAGRTSEALGEAAQWVRAEVPGAQTSAVHLDLTSLASVRAAASAIRDITPAVHVLMNNAGVM